MIMSFAVAAALLLAPPCWGSLREAGPVSEVTPPATALEPTRLLLTIQPAANVWLYGHNYGLKEFLNYQWTPTELTSGKSYYTMCEVQWPTRRAAIKISLKGGTARFVTIALEGDRVTIDGKAVESEAVEQPAPEGPNNLAQLPPTGLDPEWCRQQERTPVAYEKLTIDGKSADPTLIANSLDLPNDAGKLHLVAFHRGPSSGQACSWLRANIGDRAKLDCYDTTDPKNEWRVAPFKIDQDREFGRTGFKLAIMQGDRIVATTHSEDHASLLAAYRRADPSYDPNKTPSDPPSPPGPLGAGADTGVLVMVVGVAVILLCAMMMGATKPQPRTRRIR